MPVEIKELHIRINVDSEPEQTAPEDADQDLKEEIIAECVEQVMELLAMREER